MGFIATPANMAAASGILPVANGGTAAATLAGAGIVLTTTDQSIAGIKTFTTSEKVGAAGTAVTQVKVYTFAWTPSLVASLVTAEQTVAVAGLVAATDKVLALIPPAAIGAGLAMGGTPRVSADNTLAVNLLNTTIGGLTPPSGNWTVVVLSS